MVKLTKASGAREQRWAHLLCGPVDEATLAQGSGTRAVEGAAMERMARLEAEVAELRATVNQLCAELGISPASTPA